MGDEYDSLGAQTRSGLDMDRDGTLDAGQTDRVTDTASGYEEDGSGDWWQVSSMTVYAEDNRSAVTTTGLRRVRLSGLSSNLTEQIVSIDIHGNASTNSAAVNRALKRVTRTASRPGSSNASVTVEINGLVQTREGATGHEVAYRYDALGRRTQVIDPRTGTNTTCYDSRGRVSRVIDAAGCTNSYAYDSATGRRIAVTNAVGQITRYAYRYDAWGRVLGVYESDGVPLHGRWYSWRTGLYYFRARWYEPITGRWLSKDPIGIFGGLNQYAFVGRNRNRMPLMRGADHAQ